MNQNKSITPVTISYTSAASFEDAHGEIPYGMTNDYMFRAVLQSNNKVLKGLICSLLHLPEWDVLSVEITNPFVLGQSFERKEFRLDINVCLNNYTLINLEMQIANRLNWQKRSTLYLCRSFDSLNRGQDYVRAVPVIHIGFLDYTLFNDFPEFYATYKLLNVKNHQIYSDSLTLSVVNLTRTNLATTEDKQWHIDCWAKLFKAKTWEDLKMLADKNKYLEEASKSIFQFNTDEQIRKMCLDREEYYQDLHSYEQVIAQKDSIIAEKDALIEELLAKLKQHT